MKTKPLLQISVATSPEAEEAVVELLTRLFARPVAVYINEETRMAVVSVYCERRNEWNSTQRTALRAGLREIRAAGLDPVVGTISARRVPREDWAESWKRHFKPITIGSRLLIKPSWIKRRPRKGQAVVVLDPGLSFGTGNHPTTAFCLRELVARCEHGKPQSFWDIGTGSGILAIAAAKLGYSPIHAIDFDAEAIRVACENAQLNAVSNRLSLRRQDIRRSPLHGRDQYDLICANLISNLLIKERERIVNRLRQDGVLILAGILKTEFASVRRAYEAAGLHFIRSATEGEWESGAFRVAGLAEAC